MDRPIEADRFRLIQLLENLFRNSVEHGSTSNRAQPGDAVEHGSTGNQNAESPGDAVDHNDSGVEVTVGALNDGFYIADDGTGIPQEARDQAFERGYTTAADGTGLGLDIVSQVAAAHDWELSVGESSDGGFRVEFTGVETPSADAGS